MFCIDYLLDYSSWGRQIVFIINIEETVSESNRGRPSVQRRRGQGGTTAAGAQGSVVQLSHQRNVTRTTNHITSQKEEVKPNWKCVQSNKMDGSRYRNISSIVPWIRPGRKSISSGWLCSGAQPKQRSVYFECLSTSFIQAQIHFRRAVDTLRSKTRTR